MAESSAVSEQCLACRLISASALVGAGFYVYFNAKSCHKDISKNIMKGLGGLSVGVGLIRLFDLYPCKHKFCQT